MTDAYTEAPREMLKPRARLAALFEARVTGVLNEAGIPEASFGENEEGDLFCDRSGYRLGETGRRYASIAIIGNSTIGDISRQMARDELTQRTRAALDADGLLVTVNAYGYLRAVER